jgi:hypothetical protein
MSCNGYNIHFTLTNSTFSTTWQYLEVLSFSFPLLGVSCQWLAGNLLLTEPMMSVRNVFGVPFLYVSYSDVLVYQEIFSRSFLEFEAFDLGLALIECEHLLRLPRKRAWWQADPLSASLAVVSLVVLQMIGAERPLEVCQLYHSCQKATKERTNEQDYRSRLSVV